MSTSQLKQILVFVGIIIGIILALYFISNSIKTTSLPRNLFQTNFSSVNKVIIKSPAQELIFEKKDEIWSVNGLKGDQSSITELMTLIEKTQVTSLASNNKDSFANFELSESVARTIQIFNNNNLLEEALIGKTGATDSSFVRFPNNDNVYTINKDPNTYINLPSYVFRDKSVFDIDISAITKLSINDISITRIDNKWKLEGNSNEKIDEYLRKMISLKAIVIVPEDTIETTNVVNTVNFQFGNETKSYPIYFYEEEYFVRAQELIYKISKEDFDSLNLFKQSLL